MTNPNPNQYMPDYIVPPGETLAETLESYQMPQVELARRIGRTPKLINEIIAGKAPITPDTALLLEQVLGVPARLWNNLERHYQEGLARMQARERLQAHVSWLDHFPVADMCQLGWIAHLNDAADQLRELLKFFGVAAPEQWDALWLDTQAAFRQSPAFEADRGAVAAWLRRGELQAQQIECAAYDAARFRTALKQIRTLTTEPPQVFQPALEKHCAEAGVAFVLVPELPRIRLSGATRWLSPTKALIQLSLRYKSDDQLWFTFFHEAAHILLHGKRDIFIEDENSKNDKERAADQFAADWLIPPTQWRQFATRQFYSQEYIQDFAARLGIAPGIVVGRLQHEGKLAHTHCNGLKRRLEWVGTTAIVVAA